MNENLSSFVYKELELEFDSIAIAMFSSTSIEELLKTFLKGLGEQLAASRVAIYHCKSRQEGNILVEAVSPEFPSIKNKILPITYFGADSIQHYPCDRSIVLSDIDRTTEILMTTQDWQTTQVKAMMSAPILFNSSSSIDKIWGLAIVQQCNYSRQWLNVESDFLFEVSQVLGQCLQTWDTRLRESISSQKLVAVSQVNNIDFNSKQEELIVKRVELTPSESFQSSQLNTQLEEIVMSGNIALPVDEEYDILGKIRARDNETAVNIAVNLAMQRLNWEMQYGSSQFTNTFVGMDKTQSYEGIDVESTTLEDVLEDQTHNKVEYLQKKVNELVNSLQQKSNEFRVLERQLQELTSSQEELQQLLLCLMTKKSF